jgi:8-oxo-dGTP pyrophosphatase MutT (NUDIX family)
MSEAPRPWQRERSERGPDLLVCRARFDWVTNPRNGALLKRTVLETPEWVNVVALTPRRELVLVRQYRFGTRSVTTEIPGGVVDPGEGHLQAAQRELREECGFTSERWTYLGAVEPNPAFHDNLCHHWLAQDARATQAQALDPGEDIEIAVEPLERVLEAVKSGAIRHALVLCALARVADLRAN